MSVRARDLLGTSRSQMPDATLPEESKPLYQTDRIFISPGAV